MRAGMLSVGTMLAVVALAGCGGTASEPRTVQGECADAYGASVCTWATLDGADAVTEFGATVALASLEGAPPEMEMAWPPVAEAIDCADETKPSVVPTGYAFRLSHAVNRAPTLSRSSRLSVRHRGWIRGGPAHLPVVCALPFF